MFGIQLSQTILYIESQIEEFVDDVVDSDKVY